MKVLDLSVDVAGGFCSKLLAMNGARVRRLAPPGTDWIARYLHTHKELVEAAALADQPDGLLALAAEADVVVTSFEAGRPSGPGAELAEAALADRCPALVHLVTSSFGRPGPYAAFHSHPLVDWAAGGYLFITGDPDWPPLAGPELLCGYVAGYTAAVAVEAALARRRRTGRGSRLDISTMESMLSMHQSTFSRLGASILRTRTGRYTEVFPLVVLPCQDGYVSIGVVTDDEFDRLAVAMDRPDLPLEARFASSAERTRHQAELEPIVRQWLEGRRANEVVAILHRHRLPSAKVASPDDVLDNEQLAFRGYWDTTVVDGRSVPMPGNPLGPGPVLGPVIGPPVRQAPRQGGGSLPLGGPDPVVVLDLTAFWAGPSATRNLADLGAEVIRIERPGSRLDFGAAETGDPVQALFDHKTNRKKQSVVIDLRHPEGRNVFLDLVERTDVVVDNYRAGVMEDMGLGHEQLAERNGALVHVALSGFGSRGPWSEWRSYGPTIEAASSIEFRTRYPGSDEPLRLGHTLPDGVGGLVGAYAVLYGLRLRAETRRGVYFDVSQLEAYCALSGEELLAWAAQRAGVPTPAPPPEVHPQGVYPSRGTDEWVVMAPRTASESDAILGLLGVSSSAELASRTVQWEKGELAAELQRRGVPAFPVLRADELAADSQLGARGYFVEVEFDRRTVALPGSPFSAVPVMADPGGAPPGFGAHTVEVLRRHLGLGDERIDELVRCGAVQVAPALRR